MRKPMSGIVSVSVSETESGLSEKGEPFPNESVIGWGKSGARGSGEEGRKVMMGA